MALTPDDLRHGTPNGYMNLKCRCAPCRKAWTVYHIAYMDRHPEQRQKALERQASRRLGMGRTPRSETPRRVEESVYASATAGEYPTLKSVALAVGLSYGALRKRYGTTASMWKAHGLRLVKIEEVE